MEKGKDGRWLLWKHRDSGHPDNYVRAFPHLESREATDSTPAIDGQLAYVALFNAEDLDAQEAWIGFNEAGFAVMNTATYNIPAPQKGWEDREGFVMTQALRTCRTLDDFYRLLLEMPRPRGVQANFGAIDAEGNGAYFETDNDGCVVFRLDSFLTRTNFSISGGKQKRLGYCRYLSENHQIDSILREPRQWAPAGRIAAEDFIETLSRSLWLPIPSFNEQELSFSNASNIKGVNLLDGSAPTAGDCGDVISRRSSCASVVIEGPLPGEDPAVSMIMWTAIGFPTLSVVEPVTLDSVPQSLQGHPVTVKGKIEMHSSLCDSVNILRNSAFLPVPKGYKPSLSTGGSKAKYLFDLPYLREQIPLRHKESLPRYDKARQRQRR